MPCAGLANRMRAIASGLCAAEDFDCSGLAIVWKFDRAIFTAPFHMMFDMRTLPKGIVKVEETYFEPDSSWATAYDCTSEEKWSHYVARQGTRRPYKIKSWARFYVPSEERWVAHLRSLPIHPSILAQVADTFQSPRSRMVGVHIRRTDHRKAIQGSPSAAFWAAMNAELAVDPDTQFYVASDDETERQEAMRRFPGRVRLGPNQLLGRNDPYGCRDAMVDLIALSKCEKIIGSEGSSFSEIASAIGNTPLQVARD